MASPLGLTIKTSLDAMVIGDCIACRYTATTSGVAGYFSELGTCIANEIPIVGTATPDGLFYFIKTGKGTWVADRVIQTNISWDVLNTAKFIEGIVLASINLPIVYGSDSVIPVMGSNSQNGFIITSNSFQGVYDPYCAFDSILSNSWYSGTANPSFLKVQLPSKKVIGKYIITEGFNDGQFEAIKSWTFQGSNDGTTWTIIDTRVNITDWVMNTPKEFIVSNPSLYLYYKINITASNASNYGCISELKLIEITATTPYLVRSLSGGCAYTDSNGNSAITDQSLGTWPANNEWDKYIVNSTLSGKITKGDSNVWHWGIGSSCKETPSLSIAINTKRTARGCTRINKFEAGLTSSTTADVWGFRPVLNYVEADIQSEVIF